MEDKITKELSKQTNYSLILANSINIINYSNTIEEEAKKLIVDNSKLSNNYYIWLKETDAKLCDFINSSKMLEKFKKFSINNNHKEDKLKFPKPKNIPILKSNFFHIAISQEFNPNKSSFQNKRIFPSFENDLGILKKEKKIEKESINPNQEILKEKMEIIVEQPSREEKDALLVSNINNQTQQDYSKNLSCKDCFVQTVNKMHNNMPPLQLTPSFYNINYDYQKNKCLEQNFTFAKTVNSSNWKPQILSTAPKIELNQIIKENESPKQIEEWINPFKVTNQKTQVNTKQLTPSQFIEEAKNISTLVKEEEEYNITDESVNSDEDECSKDFEKEPKIPKWAKDTYNINRTLNCQNNNKIEYTKIFGKCVIDHLNLNMIFFTNNPKYQIRDSTADWRNDDNTNKSNNTIVFNYNENNNVFPQTNRQLNF